MPSISFKVNPEYAQISEVVPGLFICGVSALTFDNMSKNGITMIINATSEVPNLRSLGNIQRAKLWIEDTPQIYIYPHLDLQSDQIQALIADNGKVLVHSVAGVSRSVAICLAFLTKYRCHSLYDAYHLMALKRPMVRPNLGFWRQLIEYEQDVKHVPSSVRLVPDDDQPDRLIPDVYLKLPAQQRLQEHKDPKGSTNGPGEQQSSGQRTKFQPVLEPLNEVAEAAA
ncbi:Dual specificity protein phosphatase 14 [Toxocara canis]|uniref:Dual specificity protein phosphatase 14 n=1 Tax=Toxocara canis TaxID=6265 RepID=A0A0B2VUF5_TOXCA|nr:Dual specificity protein phosphatase 14 [Toxocara canis]